MISNQCSVFSVESGLTGMDGPDVADGSDVWEFQCGRSRETAEPAYFTTWAAG